MRKQTGKVIIQQLKRPLIRIQLTAQIKSVSNIQFFFDLQQLQQ